MAHIVRNAYTRRCSRNIHGHSYLCEIMLEWAGADNAQMLIDFGIIKKVMGEFVDSFDHSFLLWNLPADSEVIRFAVENFERVIITPFSSSAESQAKMFAVVMQVFLNYMKEEFSDFYPRELWVNSAKVHETTTWWAEWHFSSGFDVQVNYPIQIFDNKEVTVYNIFQKPDVIYISKQIADEWKLNIAEIYNKYLSSLPKESFTK